MPLLILLSLTILTQSRIHNLEGRIVNGEIASTADYPWIVSLQWTQDGVEGRNVACTGSIIRTEYPASFMTAAHCCNGLILKDSGYKFYGDIGRQYPYTKVDDDDYIYESATHGTSVTLHVQVEGRTSE